MGLLPSGDVDSFVVVGPPSFDPPVDTTVTGTVLTVGDVIAANGPRVPDAATAPNTFTARTIVVTRGGLLTDREMAFFDYFAARGEATSELPFSLGFEQGMTKPFALATRGLGTLVTGGICGPSTPPPSPPPLPKLCKGLPCRQPWPFGGVDGAVIVSPIAVEGLRTSLRTKLATAANAFVRGQPETAANALKALLTELQVQSEKGIPAQTAMSLDHLIRGVAAELGIHIEKKK